MNNNNISIFGHSTVGNRALGDVHYPEAIPFDRVKQLFDFNVEFSPVYTETNGEFTAVNDRVALRRADTGHVLNLVGKGYAIHQFSEVLIENLLALTDAAAGDLEIHGAGLLKNGAVGWVQVTAPMMRVVGDELAPTITLASSHNGTLATTYRAGLNRFRCSNQLPLMRKRAGAFKLRHTKNSRVSIAAARDALGLMWAQTDEFAAEVEQLINTEITNRQFAELVDMLNPKPRENAASSNALTRWENRRDTLWDLWANDERVGFHGTAWGAVQTFSTYRQWERPFRANTSSGLTSRSGRVMSDYLSGKIASDDTKTVAVVRRLVTV